MKAKKSAKSDLEKKRTLFLQMGITIVLSGMLVAFEWGNSELEMKEYAMYDNSATEIEDIAPITRHEISKPKPPVRPIEFIVIEDDEPIIEDDPIYFDPEDDSDLFPDFGDDDIEKNVVEELPLVIVEFMPKYRGGSQAEFQKHVQQIVKYPETAIDMNIQGRVFVNFVIDKNGKLTKPNIVRSPDDLLSNAVLEALAKTETWKPGMQRTRKVPVTFTIPIYFKLN